MNKLFVILFIFLFQVVFLSPTLNADEINKTISSGTIDSYVFSRSIPKQMTVGDPYRIPIQVKNIGDESATFRVILETDGEYFYPPVHTSEKIELNPGGSLTTEFYITPIKPKIGEVDITAKLYKIVSKHPVLQEEITAQVLSIKTRYAISKLLMFLGVLIVAVGAVFIIQKSVK